MADSAATSFEVAPLLPCAAPRWLTADRIAVSAVTLAGATAAVPATALPVLLVGEAYACGPTIGSEVPIPGLPLAAVIVSTAVLSAFHARRITKNPGYDLSGRSTRLGGMLGALNSAAALGLVVLFSLPWMPVPHLDLALLAGVLLLIGLPAGTILGLLFGRLYYFPLHFAWRTREAPAHDAAERALVFCGSWLSPVGISCCVPWLPAPIRVLSAIAGVLGLVSIEIGLLLRRRRRRWLQSVARRSVAGWAIDPSVRLYDPGNLIPFYRRRGSDFTAVLLRCVPAPSGPYRSTIEQPVALLATEDLQDLHVAT
jgi:hypothetical protein